MLSPTEHKSKALLKSVDLFSLNYVKEHIKDATTSYCDWDENNVRFFIGFSIDENIQKWKEFAYMQINKNNGVVTMLDFRLPSGHRMPNPLEPIRNA